MYSGRGQSQRYCKTCKKYTLHSVDNNLHGCGCILTLPTLGLFAPFWYLLAKADCRCQTCGRSRLWFFR